jgi:hypothetical protein
MLQFFMWRDFMVDRDLLSIESCRSWGYWIIRM